MSQLEQQMKPILTPMLLDQPRTLTSPEQHLLATWATKTALTMQGANIGGERFTPAAQYPSSVYRARPERNGCGQRFLGVFGFARSIAHFALPGVDAFGDSPVRGFRPFGGSLSLGCFGIHDSC
jgi:hypothetical protein